MIDPLTVQCPNCYTNPPYECMDGFLLPSGFTLFKQVPPHAERIALANKTLSPKAPQ